MLPRGAKTTTLNPMETSEDFRCVDRAWTEVLTAVYNSTDVNASAFSIEQSKQLWTEVEFPLEILYSHVSKIITIQVVVAICAFGLLGNLLTLIMLLHRVKKLTKRRISRSTESRSAKSDIWCFVALSLPDFCLCVTLIPQYYMDVNFKPMYQKGWLLFYECYEEAIINTFVLSSTWLTVSMTVNRYIHLSHPIWALRYLGRHFLLIAIFVSIVFSFIFNLPRYWLRTIIHVDCIYPANTSIYYISQVNKSWLAGYQWSYFVIGIMVPLFSLAYGNARIISAVCQSIAVEQRRNHERNLITRTLIFIVFFYICLVSPSEFIKFFEGSLSSSPTGLGAYSLINAVANLLQAVNFSCNFVPYLILDKSIRQSVIERS